MRAFLEGNNCTVWDSANVTFPASPEQADDEVETVVEPDIFVVCDQRKIEEAFCKGAPDWVVEVLSPSTSRKDMREKFDLYEREGVREYWIVDPFSQSVHVYRLTDAGGFGHEVLYQSREEGMLKLTPADPGPIAFSVLSGFSVSLDDIFV